VLLITGKMVGSESPWKRVLEMVLVKVNNFWIMGIFITYGLMPKKCLKIKKIPAIPKLQTCSLRPEIGVALSVPVPLQGR
jgi:hypothetical protein